MVFKVLFSVALLFVFAGIYNMTWRNKTLDKFPFPIIKVRNVNAGWVCFFLALLVALGAWFSL